MTELTPAASASKTDRVVVDENGQAYLESVTVEQPAGSDVLIDLISAGICGSDLHAVKGEHPFMTRPFRPGHELVGRVAAVGPDADAALIGRRVAVDPNLPCRHCDHCAVDDFNICSNHAVFGCTTAGGMGDRFVIAADRLIPVPDGLSDRRAAFIEPMATPVHAVRRAGDLHGAHVLIFGAGTIGLLTLLAARDAGAAAIWVADPLPCKRELATLLGADLAYDPTAPGGVLPLPAKPQAVFDCVSLPSTIKAAVALLDQGGKLLVVGVPTAPVPVDLPLIQDRELSILGNIMYVRDDLLKAADLLLELPETVERLVTTVVPLQDAARAFEVATHPDEVKVLVIPGSTVR